jgi:acyl dehydratase
MNVELKAPGLGTDALEEARQLLGQDFRIERWNCEASRDVIRHYAWGLGDDNPLFCDPDYAATTRHGGLIAPPTFLYSVFDAVVAPGLPDIQWFYSGTDWTFVRPVRRNEEIVVRARLADAREISGKTVERMILQTGEVIYSTLSGEEVGRCLSHCYRVPRMSAEGGLQYASRPTPTWTEAEIERLEQGYVDEYVRGADTLYWEDVEPGQEIPSIFRGPLNRLDMTCYYAGSVGTSGYKSTKLKFKYAHWAKHDPAKLPNNYDASYYSAAVSPSIGHQDEVVAQRELGMPNAYDNGPQRIGFMHVMLTNWIGDDGEVRSSSVRLRLPVIFGDLTIVKGKVTGKRIAGNDALVDCDIWAETQRGPVTANGTATVALPRRGA